MGGVLLIGTVVVSTLLWAKPENPFVWLVLFSTVFMGGIGLYDDWLKVSKKSSDGISSRMKFALQCLLAGIFTIFLLLNPKVSTIAQQLYFPFIKDPLLASMGWFSFIFFLLVIVGTSNAVNLTDGLDGLATGCTATVAATYAVLVYVAGNIKAASYLQIPYVAYSGELAVLCVALLGACLGFLWWNAHPARVFMGDTGSLAIEACWDRSPFAANRNSSSLSWAGYLSLRRCRSSYKSPALNSRVGGFSKCRLSITILN